jgi:hypothetical protein
MLQWPRPAAAEVRRHIEIAWAFVTTHEMGQLYLADVTERKAKVDGRTK